MDRYEGKLTFTHEVLGTVPKNKEVYAAHIATKAALTDEEVADELATVEHVEEKGWTGFHTDSGGPFLLQYMVKGFFKDACGMLRRVKGTRSAGMRAYKKIIDGLVFVSPDRLRLRLPPDGEMGVCERPLRAQTAQGERIALARSDTCPPGTTLEFDLAVMGQVDEELLREWLDYGEFRGLACWRNSGKGRFVYTMEKVAKAMH